MVFRGRGGRPPRGRGFRGRGGRGVPVGRVREPVCRAVRSRSRSRSRERTSASTSRSSSSKTKSHESRSRGDSSRDSRDRHDSRDRYDRKDSKRKESSSHSSSSHSVSVSEKSRKKRDRSATPPSRSSKRSDHRRSRSRSPSDSKERSRGRGHSAEFRDDVPGQSRNQHQDDGYFDDQNPPTLPGPSRWDSPEHDRNDSPPNSRRSRSPGPGAVKFSTKAMKTESLRITVGNERFQGVKSSGVEDKPLSAMERLGPPVSQQEPADDLDDLYQDLPPPVEIPSMPPVRKEAVQFSIGNRDEPKKRQTDEGRQQSSNLPVKEKTRPKEKRDKEGGKRSKDKHHEDDRAAPRQKDREGKPSKGRHSKERDNKERSRERSYEQDRHTPTDRNYERERHTPTDRNYERERHTPPDQNYDRDRRTPTDHRYRDRYPSDRPQGHLPPEGIPHHALQNPLLDPAFNQASLLVQSIRHGQNTSGPPPLHQQHPMYPGGPDGPHGGGPGGHPPHAAGHPPHDSRHPPHGGAPYGADGMYHQSPQGSFPNVPGPGGPYPNQPGLPPPPQFGMPPGPAGQQQFPPVQQQYHQPESTQQQSAGFPPVSSAYGNQGSNYSSIPGVGDEPPEKTVPGNFGSVDEEDLFLYGDGPSPALGAQQTKSQTDSSTDFWSKVAGPTEEYIPEVVKPPSPKKEPEKPQPPKPSASGNMEDDQIKKILSVIGFDFDLAKKIADQKKQQEEEERLRKQARASKKSSKKPSTVQQPPAEPIQPPQAIASLAGRTQTREDETDEWGNPQPQASFNPSGSFLDSGGAQQATTSESRDHESLGHHAKDNQSQQAYQQHDRMPPQQQGPVHGAPPQQGGAPPGGFPPPMPLPPMPLPPVQYDAYGRPIPPPHDFPPPHPGYTPPPQQPYYPPHPGAPPHPPGYGQPPSTHPAPYYPDQHGTQFPAHPQQPYGNHPQAQGRYQESQGYQPSTDFKRGDSRERSYSRSRSSSGSRSSSSSSSSGSESPERSPPRRDRSSRSHSQSVTKDQEDDRENRERSRRVGKRDEYGPELPSRKEKSPKRIVLLPKSEREESSRKRKFSEDKDPSSSLDKLKDLERTELKKLRQLYKDEREALEKKKKREEEKERALEEKKLQQAIKRKEAERRKEREIDAKKRQAIEKRKKDEEERRRKEDEQDREESERARKEKEMKKRIQEAKERAYQIKLSQDKHIYSKRLEALESALGRLRKQEGELLRKKQRERAGHKDPILVENTKLQDAIHSQLKALRAAYTEGRVQLVKFEDDIFKDEIKLRERAFEKTIQEVDARKAKEREEKKGSKSSRAKTDEERAERQPFQFTYTDPGNHWCKLCKLSLQSLNNLFIHLHSKKHMQKCDPYCRPWVPDDISSKKPIKGNTVAAALGGAEFMMPVNAFYCKLCREFSGDGFCASEHLKSVKHNLKYQKFVEENPNYVKKMEIERAADEKTDVKEEQETGAENSLESWPSRKDKEDKKDDKSKIKVDIGQRGGFGKFRFMKKENENSKNDESKGEAKEIKKEEKNEQDGNIELRKSDSKPVESDKDKKDGKKDNKITIKLSGRQFVPTSVVKHAAPAAKPPPPPAGKSKTPPISIRAAAAFNLKQSQQKNKPKAKKNALDSFLDIGGQALPVIKDIEKKKQEVPSEDAIAKAFGGSKGGETAKKDADSTNSDQTSEEDSQKPSFSDTLKKMLFSAAPKEEEEAPALESEGEESPKGKSSFSSIFNTMLSGIQPGIPGIDDGDELKPPGT